MQMIFVLLLLAAPAHAAGNAPGAALTEGPYREWVQVEAVLSRVDIGAGDMAQVAAAVDHTGVRWLGEYGDPPIYCGSHVKCGGGDPAPVPLPFSGLLLASALGLLWRMKE